MQGTFVEKDCCIKFAINCGGCDDYKVKTQKRDTQTDFPLIQYTVKHELFKFLSPISNVELLLENHVIIGTNQQWLKAICHESHN